ncbi:MAG: MarC family protein [Myxococcota bacterium]
MTELSALFVKAFFAFLAIMNPLANIPVFLGVTSDATAPERRAIALRSILVAFLLVATFTVAGQLLLRSFGVEIPSIRVFGGLIVMRVGFDLITQNAATSHSASGGTHEGLGRAISPLGIPILAGPGTLATAMGLSPTGDLTMHLVVIAAFAAVAVLTLVAFLASGRILEWLGEELIAATTKVMGMILGAIGTQMLVQGLRTMIGT